MKQNKSFDSKILFAILGGAILALLLFSCTNQRLAIQTVTFDANGGTLSGEASVTVFTGFPVAEPGNPTRSGYAFDGWYLKGSSSKYDFSQPVVSDITLVARWTTSSSTTPTPPPTPSSYTVTYHAMVDGAESNAITVPPSATVQAGSTLQTPSDPTTTDTSLVFIGWSTSDTEYVALAQNHTMQGDLDLWAVFVTKSSYGETDNGMLYYKFDENIGGYTVREGYDSTGDIVIPSTINGAPVVAILEYAFENNTSIASIDLSKATNLKTIGNGAFMNTNIKSLTIPGNVETVGSWIVEGCTSLEEVKLQEGIKNLSASSFYDAAIKAINIPSTITEIPKYCFGETLIESIEIHDGITSIGEGAFYNCANLNALTIPRSVETVGGWIVQGCSSLEKITLQEGIKKLSASSFYDAAVKTIKIPSSITEIPDYCFESAAIENIELHDGITSIGEGAFIYCAKLTNLTIPAGSIKTIGLNAFFECSNLTSFDLTGVETIGERAFAYTGITSIHIPASVNTVGYGAFEREKSGDSLTVTFEEGFNGLAAGSFCNTSISTIEIPKSVTAIPTECFFNATLPLSVTLHNGITEIGDRAFFNAKISEIQLPTRLTRIGDYAFANCEFVSLTLPDSLTYIGEQAFSNNPITGILVIPASVTVIGQIAFYGTDISGIVFSNETELTIGSQAFASTKNLREVTLPSSSVKLNIDAFTYSADRNDANIIGIHSITVPTGNPNQITLSGTSANASHCIVYVPDADGAVDVYKASDNWCGTGRFNADNIKPVSSKSVT